MIILSRIKGAVKLFTNDGEKNKNNKKPENKIDENVKNEEFDNYKFISELET